MRMNFDKLITFVALEAAAFKHEATVLIYAVALCTHDARNGRMLAKRLKAGGRVGPYEEACFLSAALPRQNHRVQSRRNL